MINPMSIQMDTTSNKAKLQSVSQDLHKCNAAHTFPEQSVSKVPRYSRSCSSRKQTLRLLFLWVYLYLLKLVQDIRNHVGNAMKFCMSTLQSRNLIPN